MLRVKSQVVAPALATVLMALMGWTGPARAGTDLSNVAWNRPVSSAGGVWYGRVAAANEEGTVIVDGSEAMALINDDLFGDTNWAYPRTDGGGAWIDLGAEYDIASIEVIPRSTAHWNRVELATVYGSAYKTTAGDYSFIIPDKSSSNLNHVQTVNWRGVRWIRIVDESNVFIGVGDTNYLTFSDIRVVAPVATYSNFVGGVRATATSTYNAPLTYSPDFLVNHQGMSDQHGPVGATSAKSNANVGLWMTEDLGAGGFVDQAVTFDLGGTFSLDQMRIWNFNASAWSTSAMDYIDSTNRGVNAALIEYSQDGGKNYLALADTNGTSPGNYTIPKALTNSNGSPKQNYSQLAINLADLVADHIRFTVKTSHGDTTYAGLSEVRFYGDLIPADPIPGDATGDGVVDLADTRRLADYWGASGEEIGWEEGDFDGDHVVGPKDAAILATNWGHGVPAPAMAVPEPSTLALLLGAPLLLLLRRPW